MVCLSRRETGVRQRRRFILNDGGWTDRHQSSLKPHRNDRACDLITRGLFRVNQSLRPLYSGEQELQPFLFQTWGNEEKSS